MDRPLQHMRIAYLTSEYPTVSHTFILREIEALRALGHEIETCSVRETPASQQRGPAEKAAAASTFYILRAARNPRALLKAILAAVAHPQLCFRTFAHALKLRSPGAHAFMRQMIYFVEATILAQHFKQRGVTHVHNHFANPSATVAMLAAQLAEIPFSFTLHGPSDLLEPVQSRLDAKIERASFVACISNFARSQAMLHSDPAHWDKLQIVHCGVEPRLYAAAGDVRDTPPAFIFVGRLAPVKGLRLLIEAFGRVLAEEPNAKLTVVGDGPDRTWLKDAVKPYGASVQVAGALSQAEVAEELKKARALVLPSFAEGVPVVLMEAMASGRPVIASQVAGVGELVETGISGYLTAPGDVEALTDRMLTLARDIELAAQMGAAGRDKVKSDFDISAEAEKIGALFTQHHQGQTNDETV